MGGIRKKRYEPNSERRVTYERLFGLYKRLHDSIGTRGTTAGVSGVMKELLAIRDETSA